MYHFWIVPINSCMYACMHECMDARNARNALNAHNAPDAHNARSMVQRNITTWQVMSNSVRKRNLLGKTRMITMIGIHHQQHGLGFRQTHVVQDMIYVLSGYIYHVPFLDCSYQFMHVCMHA